MKRSMVLVVSLACLSLAAACSSSSSGGGATLPEGTTAVGEFLVTVDAPDGEPASIRVAHRSDPSRVLWETTADGVFVEAAQAEADVVEERGSFTITDNETLRCSETTVTDTTVVDDTLVVMGTVDGDEPACGVGFTLTFAAESANQIGFDLALDDAAFNRTILRYAVGEEERFFGFGEQFTFVDVTGKEVPILTQEQGIGRGQEPLTSLLNLFSPGSGGGPFSTYYAVPFYLTDQNNSLLLENAEYSLFNLETPGEVSIKLFASEMRGRVLRGDEPLEIVEELTEYTGRMRPLPDWVLDGAIVGMQGGTAEVREKREILRDFDTPIAAFWLQDWVGQRQTAAVVELGARHRALPGVGRSRRGLRG